MKQIPNYDLHNHTIHCDHANPNATVQNLANKAYALGLDCLGISEHVRFPEEIVAISRLREDLSRCEFPKTIPLILLGGELDPDPVPMNGQLLADPSCFDYVILSIHRLPKTGIGVWQFHEQNYTLHEVKKIGQLWMEWLGLCVENSCFDILGHPLRFPIELGLFDIQQDRVFYSICDILKKLAARKAAFEINNAFIRTLIKKGLLNIYVDLMRELKTSGVKFTRGSDSHNVNDLGVWDAGKVLAESAGLKESDWFDPCQW